MNISSAWVSPYTASGGGASRGERGTHAREGGGKPVAGSDHADHADQVTQILQSFEAREDAAEALLPLVYDQLRAIAERRMGGERSSHTLQATALVHEAYMRLVDADRAPGRIVDTSSRSQRRRCGES